MLLQYLVFSSMWREIECSLVFILYYNMVAYLAISTPYSTKIMGDKANYKSRIIGSQLKGFIAPFGIQACFNTV